MKWGFVFLAVSAMVAAAPAEAELDLTRAEVSHLPDGLTVIMLEDHSFPVVSVQMLYKSGSAAEISGKTGLAHFMEHLAFRGSRNFPDERATELIYDGGGEWHGYTAFDQTTYFSTMPRDGLDTLLKIEADRMARTIIDPASIEAERGAVITELHSYENDPASVLQDSVARTAIQAHPYGSPMAGYVSDVERLTAEDARDYYESHYAPGNAVLAIVGDFVPSEARALVAREFADVPARAVASPRLTTEPPQRGQRRLALSGAVDRQYFELAFPSPAASSADFPAFLVLQQILSGGEGLNLHQSDWSAAPAVKGSLLFGASTDIATFLPPTRDPFLFTVSGSIAASSDRTALEHDVADRIAALHDRAAIQPRLEAAKAAVVRELKEDVPTTQEAAHQLAFFEGIGALDALLDMPRRIEAVTAADVQRVAGTYLRLDESTSGWMIPGPLPPARPGKGNPSAAGDRPGSPPPARLVAGQQFRELRSGLPAIVEANPLSSAAAVELLLSAPAQSGVHPRDLPGLDAVLRAGNADQIEALVLEAIRDSRQRKTGVKQPSADPATRLQQLLLRETGAEGENSPAPLAVIVSGDVDPNRVFDVLQRDLGEIRPATLPVEASSSAASRTLRVVRERIRKPLAQGAIGYVVEGPPEGTRDALAWQMLLYVLTHDYSGRLGRSAIKDKGIVYHIYSDYRSDGRRTWATISTGVDGAKADAMEDELRSQLSGLIARPPSAAELDAARNHLLGRDLTAAQTDAQWTSKLARDFVACRCLRSHQQLQAQLDGITPADLAAAAHDFATGTIVRVDVLELP